MNFIKLLREIRGIIMIPAWRFIVLTLLAFSIFVLWRLPEIATLLN